MTDAAEQKPADTDRYAASVFFKDARDARAFVASHDLDWGEELESRDPELGYGVGFYATAQQIEALEKDGFSVVRGENLSELGRKRMSEIGTGDRFADGKSLPTGLGRKLGGK